MDRFEAMCAWLAAKKEAERLAGARMFMGWPDRWFADGVLFRCENGHVSSRILKCEEDGDRCLAGGCHGRCKITFPEDYETSPPTPIEGPADVGV